MIGQAREQADSSVELFCNHHFAQPMRPSLRAKCERVGAGGPDSVAIAFCAADQKAVVRCACIAALRDMIGEFH